MSDNTSHFAYAFVMPEECGVVAAQHHSQLLLRGMSMSEVDALLSEVAPHFEHHEVLLKLALFGHTYARRSYRGMGIGSLGSQGALVLGHKRQLRPRLCAVSSAACVIPPTTPSANDEP